MEFVICVVLLLVAFKCGKAMYIEFKEDSGWGWMWLLMGAAALCGVFALVSN